MGGCDTVARTGAEGEILVEMDRGLVLAGTYDIVIRDMEQGFSRPVPPTLTWI